MKSAVLVAGAGKATGARESMLQNSALQLFYAPNDEMTGRYLSQRLGTTTIRTVTDQPVRGRTLRSRSFSHTGRALMLPEEVRELGPDEALVLQEGARPVRAAKIRYYAERALSERVLPAAPVPSLVLASVRPPLGSAAAACLEGAESAELEDDIETILNEHAALQELRHGRRREVRDEA